MVICQYFLKGTCKFGDRCFNEHRRPGNRGSFNQEGRAQRNYQQDSHGRGRGHSNNYGGSYDRNAGGRNAGYDDSYTQGFRNQKNYQENWGGRHGDSGYHGDRKGGGGGRDGYDNYGGRTQGSRDRYHYDVRDKNRYSVLSHQPDPELPSFDRRSHQPRGRTQSTTSQHSATMDQKLERMRKDMKEWGESGQWPLSCYAPLASEPCVDGLVDISPEEMRSEAYKANNDGKTESYTQSLQQTMEKYRRKKQELASMSSTALQDEMSRPSHASGAMPGGLFGGLASSAQSLGETSLFGDSMSTTTSSPGLFGPSPQSSLAPGPFAPNPASTNPSILLGPSSNPFGSSPSPSSTSAFGKSQESSMKEVSSSAQALGDSAQSTAVTSSRCSEEDLQAFRLDHFVLGAIPECPPPLELC